MKLQLMLFVSALFVLVSFTQSNRDVQDILMSRVWTWDGKEIVHGMSLSIFTFSKDSTTSFFANDEERKLILPYYLSDTVEDCFDHGKVGKAKNGKYIISYSPKATPNVLMQEIISIDDFEIKLRVFPRGDSPIVITYRAVSK